MYISPYPISIWGWDASHNRSNTGGVWNSKSVVVKVGWELKHWWVGISLHLDVDCTGDRCYSNGWPSGSHQDLHKNKLLTDTCSRRHSVRNYQNQFEFQSSKRDFQSHNLKYPQNLFVLHTPSPSLISLFFPHLPHHHLRSLLVFDTILNLFYCSSTSSPS